MNSAGPAAKSKAAAPGMADVRGIALGYEPPAGDDGECRLWIPVGGSHRIVADRARTARLLDAVLDIRPEHRARKPRLHAADVRPERRARLVVLEAEVGALDFAERTALRARIAFLPAAGGLISHLNAWENIVLPLGFHSPERLHGIAGCVQDLLAGLGTEPHALLAKLPEEMTLYEKKVAGCVRMMLEAPELVLAEDLTGGLEAFDERGRAAAGFAATYLAACAGGTFIQLENALAS
jgi:hypothetical protein